jgi:MYXO-CTERM domain-containing protein
MSGGRLIAAAAAMLAALATAAVPAAPASAATSGVDLEVEATVAPFGVNEYGTRLFIFGVDNPYEVDGALEVELQIDISDLAPRVRVFDPAPGSSCSRTTSTRFICHAPPVPAGQEHYFEFSAKADEGAALGPAGSIVATLLSGEEPVRPDNNTAVLPVEVVVPPLVDMVAEAGQVVTALGDPVTVPVTVRNLGPDTARAVLVDVGLHAGMAEFLHWTNCPNAPQINICLLGDMAAGSTAHVSFTMRVLTTSGPVGGVSADANGPPYESDQDNDYTQLRVCVPPAPACGSGEPVVASTVGAGPGGGRNRDPGTAVGGAGAASPSGPASGEPGWATPAGSTRPDRTPRPTGSEADVAMTPLSADSSPAVVVWTSVLSTAAVAAALVAALVVRRRRSRPVD